MLVLERQSLFYDQDRLKQLHSDYTFYSLFIVSSQVLFRGVEKEEMNSYYLISLLNYVVHHYIVLRTSIFAVFSLLYSDF